MAVVTFNKKQVEREIGKLDENMQNKVAMFGTPIEEINEGKISIEIFPNRPDLLSYQGFKNSFLSFLGKKVGLRQYKLNKPEKDYDVYIDSSVKEIRPYTACAIVKNLKLDDDKIKEIIDFQEKLHLTVGRKRKKAAIGIYPLEKIKLPITFKALEPDKIKFTPLETNKELSGLDILQRHPTGKEYAHLLAGKAKFPVFLDANKEILSMPPIINSQLTGKVTKLTKDVFIECSGSDFEILKKCLNIVVSCLAEMGGKIYQMNLFYKKKEITPNLIPEKMDISLENTNKILGLDLKEKDLKKLTEKMGYNYKNRYVEIPPWRVDILHEIDIIEDIAIAYGYDNFEPETLKTHSLGSSNPEETISKKISDILSGLGMIEVSNYHLTNKKDQTEKIGISEKNRDFIEVKESKTDYTVLRENLFPLLLKNMSDNVDCEYPQEIFEIGKVFMKEKNSGKIIEKRRLSCATSPGNYTRIRQMIDYLFRMMNLNDRIKIKEPQNLDSVPPHFIEGRTAEVLFNEGKFDEESQDKRIGFIGEIHPKILKNWKVRMPISLFEIELEEIIRNIIKDVK
ncbi:phenylalanine--tRNA ligase subunit beta [Patescibacteria group bacterium]|nr:phenylalanine--tRNA ligase subunit beta [Patescibacteria group bacterium]